MISAVLPTYNRAPLAFVSGSGSWLVSEDGKRYLDLGAGIAVNALGHAHPAIVKAVSKQIATLGHVSNLYSHPAGLELAQKLISLTQDSTARVFFCNSGAEANEAALKLSRKTGKSRIVATNYSFHGRTMGALSLTGQPEKRNPFKPLIKNIKHVTFGDIAQMRKAVDHSRDQSYFLYGTTEAQLDYLRFPLGGMPKPQVRELAEAAGLRNAAKPDSQDICFVPDGDYAKIVRKLRPDADEGGDIVHVDGRVLGRHKGLIHYTVGQRKGLEIGGQAEPLYVVRLDAEGRRVIVGPKVALAVSGARLSDINWLGRDFTGPLTAKVRSMAKPVPARLEGDRLIFDAPEYGVAPGQAAVLYAGDQVLGGGWIAATEAALAEAA